MLTIKSVLESMKLSDEAPITVERRDEVPIFRGRVSELHDLLDEDYESQKDYIKKTFGVNIGKPLNSMGVFKGEFPPESKGEDAEFKPFVITMAR